mmetsp:Transcript_38654/g.125030  ORF Transcript_38654/g.125030 Transcript_38654/m.125030 type:complete len:201 (-) Transcript_38654:559-1161(-)
MRALAQLEEGEAAGEGPFLLARGAPTPVVAPTAAAAPKAAVRAAASLVGVRVAVDAGGRARRGRLTLRVAEGRRRRRPLRRHGPKDGVSPERNHRRRSRVVPARGGSGSRNCRSSRPRRGAGCRGTVGPAAPGDVPTDTLVDAAVAPRRRHCAPPEESVEGEQRRLIGDRQPEEAVEEEGHRSRLGTRKRRRGARARAGG